MTGASGGVDRAASRVSAGFFVLATGCWLLFGSLYLADLDPDLGYLSDPGIGRALAFVILPAVTWMVAALVWSVTRLARSSVVAWVCVAIGLPVEVGAGWLPVGAVLGHVL